MLFGVEKNAQFSVLFTCAFAFWKALRSRGLERPTASRLHKGFIATTTTTSDLKNTKVKFYEILLCSIFRFQLWKWNQNKYVVPKISRLGDNLQIGWPIVAESSTVWPKILWPKLSSFTNLTGKRSFLIFKIIAVTEFEHP